MEEIKDMVSKYKIGDIVDGGITGIVDFGIFIKIDDNLEGLGAYLRAGLVIDRKAGESFQGGRKSQSPNHQYR